MSIYSRSKHRKPILKMPVNIIISKANIERRVQIQRDLQAHAQILHHHQRAMILSAHLDFV